jgi:hypothetical protein
MHLQVVALFMSICEFVVYVSLSNFFLMFTMNVLTFVILQFFECIIALHMKEARKYMHPKAEHLCSKIVGNCLNIVRSGG